MLDTVIKKLFYESTWLAENIHPSMAYEKATDKALKLYESLTAVLDEKQKGILDEFAEAEIGVTAEASFTHFKEGLKLGLRLGFECLSPSGD